MIILGIDPALNRTGWGVVEVNNGNVLSYISSGIIDVSLNKDLGQKIKTLAAEIKKIIIKYKPSELH